MNSKIPNLIYRLRRIILKKIIPEFIWPKTIRMDNAVIPVRGMPYSFGVKRILSKGIYENSERSLVKGVIRKGDHIIEFGGSIGIMAAVMNEIVTREGFIISVEASNKLAASSKSWLEPRGNIKILAGIGFPVWEAPLKYHNINFLDDGNSLGGRVEFEPKHTKAPGKYEIYDLRKIMSTYSIRPDHLVIDIEGSEIIFLEEGIEIPAVVQNIIIEMHPNLYGQYTEDAIINKLEQLGFNMIREISHVFHLSRNRAEV